jgi:predicted secreted protein
MQRMIRYSFLILFLLNIGSVLGQDSLYYITPDQSKINVKVNEPFIIKLRACHSCGYGWTMQQDDTINVKLIKVTSKNIDERKPIGGSVFEFWKFSGGRVGTYSIEFIQKRGIQENGRFKFEIYVY